MWPWPHEPDGFYGDGIAIYPWIQGNSSAVVTGGNLSQNARAGIAAFDSVLDLGETSFDCNAIQLNGEGDFEVRDQGGNACGCQGNSQACQVMSSGLEPPGFL